MINFILILVVIDLIGVIIIFRSKYEKKTAKYSIIREDHLDSDKSLFYCVHHRFFRDEIVEVEQGVIYYDQFDQCKRAMIDYLGKKYDVINSEVVEEFF